MRLTALVAAATLVAAAGCGGDKPRAKLHGRVTLNGMPVTNGVVVFLAGDNSTHLTDILPDGTYSVAGVPFGPATVSLQQSPPRPAPRKEGGTNAKGAGETKDARRVAEPPEPKVKGPAIPPKYADPRQSNLKLEINQPDQEWSIDLK